MVFICDLEHSLSSVTLPLRSLSMLLLNETYEGYMLINIDNKEEILLNLEHIHYL